MKGETVRFKYVGSGSGGEFLHGVPARDLTQEDWARLTKAQQEIVEVSRLYKKVEVKTLKAEAEAEAKEESNGG